MSIQSILKRLPGKIQKLFDAGKEAEWNEFWDEYQKNGRQNSWNYAFYGAYWNDKTFKPKYDITFQTGSNVYTDMFRMASFTDLKGILEKQGVTLDTSGCSGTNALALFYGCTKLTRVPTLDVSNLSNGISNTFYNCQALQYVEKIILSENGTKITANTFYKCSALEEIRFEGKIASNINFGDCESLSIDSVVSIIDALSDDTTDLTATIHESYEANYFWDVCCNEMEKKPNWNFVWV